MSFIGATKQGATYTPGYFLGHEECNRETREIPQSMAVTTDTGAKYVPGGSIFPSNDNKATGIVYEDVDVTDGNMPGSVVTKGTIIEDRLPITDISYSAATTATGDNPSEKGWYERSGSAGAYVYTLSTDTSVQEGKTYYAATVTRIASAAKTALANLGFTFVSEGAVTRPY